MLLLVLSARPRRNRPWTSWHSRLAAYINLEVLEAQPAPRGKAKDKACSPALVASSKVRLRVPPQHTNHGLWLLLHGRILLNQLLEVPRSTCSHVLERFELPRLACLSLAVMFMSKET